MVMRIGLINTPDLEINIKVTSDPKFPLGLLYIASSLQAKGHKVKIFDCHVDISSESELITEITRFAPSIIGLNCMTPNRRVCYNLADIIKESLPEIVLIVGGTHATLAPEDVLSSCKSIDAVVVGEGEDIISEIVDDFNRINSIKGVVTRNNINHVPIPKCARVKNLDTIPFPNYDLINVETYWNMVGVRELYILASRGCLNNCSFCCVPYTVGKPVLFRSADNVIKEIRSLITKYNTNRFYFYDDNILSWPYLKSFCESASDIDFHWTALGRVEDVNETIAELLRCGNCLRISLGIESGSNRIQRKIGKVLPQDLMARIRCLYANNIETRGFFIIGFPDESLEEIVMTVKLIFDLKNVGLSDICVFPARPYPGTRLLSECRKLFPDVDADRFLDYIYEHDWETEPSKVVSAYLHRYDAIPSTRINRYFSSMQIRKLIREIYYMWSYADRFSKYSNGKIYRHLFKSIPSE